MINKVHCGDNIELMRKLPDNSVDMVITSPPYWGLRNYGDCADKIWGGDKDCEHDWGTSYTRHQEAPGKTSLVKQKGLEYTITTSTCTKCGAWKGQFGLEPHPQMYIEHMVEICREVKRILKPTGSFYLNLGDSYFSSPAGNKTPSGIQQDKKRWEYKDELINLPDKTKAKKSNWLQPKQLLLVPSRVACALQDDGWILRNDCLWLKPNPMPISIKDRLNNTFEHVFFFVKQQRYFYDLDAIREPHKEHQISEGTRTNVNYKPELSMGYHENGEHTRKYSEFYHPLGKNPGDVIKPLTINDHITNIYNLSKKVDRTTYDGKNKDVKTGSSSALSSTATIRKVGREYIKENNITGQIEKEILNYIQSVAGHPLGKNPGDVIGYTKGTDKQNMQPNDRSHFRSGDVLGKAYDDKEVRGHPLGKNPGDIFKVTVQPFADAHFAVFPPELVEKPIKSSCPKRICINCGEPWTEELDTEIEHNRENKRKDAKVRPDGLERVPNDWKPKNVLGKSWVKNCNCETNDYAPGIVLDIFNGSGTTCLVAEKFGRRYIGFDINPEYCKMARKRVGKSVTVDVWDNKGNFNFPIKGFKNKKEIKKKSTPVVISEDDSGIDWEV